MPLSGQQMLKLFKRAGWTVLDQRGSHVKVGKRALRETIPLHRTLARGLERKLLKRLEQTRGRYFIVNYHFRIHDSKSGIWAECLELDGCITQGRNRSQLARNMRIALNLYLDEPESSSVIFPPPLSKPSAPGIVSVEVEPAVAFSMQLRQFRINSHLTQRQAASRLGMKNLFSYQRLERRSNPSLATLKRVKALFPQLSLDAVLGS